MFRVFFLAAGLLLSQFLVAQDEVNAVNTLLDHWHHAAAVADEDQFFGAMTADCIYLGTELNEKWKRDELKSWSAKYFDRESAWNFKPFDREIYLSEDKTLAWFDEKLETWMGPCRGSGVLVLTKRGWKIKHYNLAVTIDNDKIQDFIHLTQPKE